MDQKRYCLGKLCEGELNFPTLLLSINFIFIKIYTIYLFELLVLVEIVKHLNVLHQKDKMFINNTCPNTFSPIQHDISSPTIYLFFL